MRVSIGFLGFFRLFLSGFLYEGFYWVLGFWRFCVFICFFFAGFFRFWVSGLFAFRLWGFGFRLEPRLGRPRFEGFESSLRALLRGVRGLALGQE